ncbi:MAG TPA: hypothetical protein D7H83_05130 [Candidatus Poseidoniales archaeon]|jgi:hypothetical protein|nr:hypothetical protein [Candidatus Poseidoniaceae archaeon]DAC39186.1 MAG TPA: hypothetical protein D7H83_05130 [Candidatus Poseidoniales archaeon]HIH57755.1 hypothetical protein [Candidatus Poseidoniaceae archaeon]|tara:strand:- start:49 stop:435 length:387 start_codon:yes stop_codon:yes gene_type:complete
MIDGEWDDFVPIRLPVDWEYRGEAGIHPEIEGITGKEVVLLIEKRFTRFEKILAKILRAPKVVRRSMHYTQSMLWELIDGERNFAEICQIMDSLYHEDIAPVNDRIKAYLEVFVRLNVATVLKPREEE